jgi:hypothetical protein
MEKTPARRSFFQTSNRELFEFLTEERGHTDWQVKLERGAYVALFKDSPSLQSDVSEFRKRNSRTIRTTGELLRALSSAP